MMINHKAKIGTLAAKIKNKLDLANENIVKVITQNNLEDDPFSDAKTFLRKSEDDFGKQSSRNHWSAWRPI